MHAGDMSTLCRVRLDVEPTAPYVVVQTFVNNVCAMRNTNSESAAIFNSAVTDTLIVVYDLYNICKRHIMHVLCRLLFSFFYLDRVSEIS